MTDTSPPTLSTPRLWLRPVTEDDVAAHERRFVDWEVIRHLNDSVPWPYPEGGVRDFIRGYIAPGQGRGLWAWGLHLKDRSADGLIGVVELRREAKPDNRGFWLGRDFWGRGYMTEAVTRINDFAFDELGFETLIFSNALGNDRSRAVKTRTGARLIGEQPARFVDPAYTRQEVWRLDAADWRAWRAAGTR